MSLSDFMQFYRTIASVMLGFWNVLESLKIAGIGLGSWSIGFFMLSIVIRIFFKVTTGGIGTVPYENIKKARSYEPSRDSSGKPRFGGVDYYQYMN